MSIQKEYEKHPDITPEDIKNLREWLKNQPHLPGDLISDVDLLIAYHCCEKSMEVSKQVIDLHYTLKSLIFSDRLFDKKVEFSLDIALFYQIPVFTTRGYRAIYLRLLDFSPKNFFLEEVVKSFVLIYDLWQYEEGTWPGFVVIIDLDGVVLGHLSRLDLMMLKKLLYFVQECMLIKLKEVNFINAPSFMDKLMLMLKPFLNKPLLEIIRIHSVGSEKIYETIPKKYFPIESGGEFKDMNTIKEELCQRLKANQDYFIRENKRKVNESLRPGGKAVAVESLFGIQSGMSIDGARAGCKGWSGGSSPSPPPTNSTR